MPEPLTIVSGIVAILSTLTTGIIGFIAYVNKNKQIVRELTHKDLENKINEVAQDQEDILDRVKVLEKDNQEYFRRRVLQMEKNNIN